MQYDWGWNRRDQETLTVSIRYSGLLSSGGCGGGAAITVGDGHDVGFDHIHLQLDDNSSLMVPVCPIPDQTTVQ